MKNSVITLVLLLNSMLWSGCDRSDSPIPEDGRVPITFSTEEPLSRGTVVSAYSMSEFPLKGYMVDSYEYMDVTLRRQSDGSWGTEVPYYWPPRGELMQFCAFYGATSDEFVLITPWVNNPGQQTYYFTVNKSVKEQKDLIYAISDACNYHLTPEKSVKLNFHHILAWVKVNLIGDAGAVSSIELRNLWGSGVFFPDKDNKMDWEFRGPWGGEAERHTYVIPVTEGKIAEEDANMFLIPQLTPAEAEIVINRSDGTSKVQGFASRTFFKETNNALNITLSE